MGRLSLFAPYTERQELNHEFRILTLYYRASEPPQHTLTGVAGNPE